MGALRLSNRRSAGKITVGLSSCLVKKSWLVAISCVAALYGCVSFAQVQFQDSTAEAGGPFHIGETWGASWGDLDGDIYPDLFSNNHGQKNGIYQNNGDGTFSDVTNSADLDRVWIDDPLADIHGGTWADFDNDGDQDLMVTRSSKGARIQLMENNGQSEFNERGGRYAIAPYGGGRMPLLFDYTNDGNLDVAIARNGGGLEIFKWNPGSDRYQIQTSQTGITDGCLRNNYAFVSDLFNNDKQHYVCMSESGIPEKVYDMSVVPFINVAHKVGNVGTTPDAVLADFNGDLRQDIFALRGRIRPSGAERVSSQRIEAWLAAGGSTNFEKSFTFQANGPIEVHAYARTVGQASGLKIGASGYSPNRLPVTLNPNNSDNWGVNPNHRRKAIFISYDEIAQEWTITLSGGGNGSEGAYITVSGSGLTNPQVSGLTNTDRPITPTFLMNNGSALNSAGSKGIGAISCGGIAAADFDNDMDIDLYLTCRTAASNIPNRLYLNNGNGQFTLASGTHGGEGLLGSGIDGLKGTAEMAVTADYNVDGFVDVYVTNGNRLFPHIVKDKFSGGGPVRFYKNLGNNNNWLQFDLRGVTSNRDGFGAKVIVMAGGTPQAREQNGMYHRWSHDSRRLHFGLASNTQADVRVEWPDGTVDTHNNVDANKLYRATQGGALVELSGGGTTNPPGKNLSIANASVNEGLTAEVEVTLNSASTSVITVDYQTLDGTATDGDDYSASNGTLTFAPGQISKTIMLTTLQDTDEESNEVFSVELSNPVGASISGGTATVTIIDDDTGGTLPSVSVSDVVVDENGGPAAFVIELSASSTEKVRVDYSTQSGTALAGDDFTARSGSVTFNVGETSKTRLVQISDDAIAEPEENFSMVLSNPTKSQLGQAIGVATINDDDDGGNQPTVSVSDITVDEDGGSAAFVIELSEALSETVRVNYATQSGTALAGDDFTARSGSVTFSAGQTSKTRAVQLVNDALVEPVENFSMVLSNPTNIQLGQAIAIATIEDDDTGTGPTGPIINVATSNVSLDENEEGVELIITLSEPQASRVRVDFRTVDGSATAGSDYTARALSTMTFAPGQTSKIRGVYINQDNLVEGDETLTFELSNPQGATLGNSVTNITIVDDDSAPTGPTINVATTNVSVSEGDEYAEITITLSEPQTSRVKVDYITVDGSATGGVDFTARALSTMTFAPGQTSKIREILMVQDTLVEGSETFTLELSNPQGGTLGSSVSNITILDDD